MSADTQHFTGTDQYIATDSLKLAVKAARALQKPLLVKGEPGTGKTLLAEQVAESLGLNSLLGTSSQRLRHSKAYMNTMLCLVCVIANWVMIVFTILRTILSPVNCGKLSPVKSAVCF
ncbi:ATPase [Acinetobacter baumannii]|nr:ATPase [Acinetobacter baumannii]